MRGTPDVGGLINERFVPPRVPVPPLERTTRQRRRAPTTPTNASRLARDDRYQIDWNVARRQEAAAAWRMKETEEWHRKAGGYVAVSDKYPPLRPQAVH